jgi:hypothetical protein
LNKPEFKKLVMDLITKPIWERIRKEERVAVV